ncbi:hypothetical protein B0H21DRAFT_878535 [Amylocystis lapponica]|nr:hypothetical protein B0H21DRAFT_878535 [Amylocystis lapponica]
MTEYTSSSEAVREYMSSRERTAHWVSTHSRGGGEHSFVSPSHPPSLISDIDSPSFGPSDSDAGSSHSSPPRMVLRYADGRPDVPIAMNMPRPPPPQYSHHTHSRSGSQAQLDPQRASQMNGYAQSLSYATSHHTATPHPPITPPRSPESIVVLPSRQATETPHSAIHAPPNSLNHNQYGSRVPSRPPSSQAAHHTTHSHHSNGVQPPQMGAQPHLEHAQSQPLPTPQNGGTKFFEHSVRGSRAPSQLPYNYSPPAITHGYRARAGSTPYASMAGSASVPLSPVERQRPAGPRYNRSQSRGRAENAGQGRPNTRGGVAFEDSPSPPSRSPSPSMDGDESDRGSRTSGSTYYVLPSPGQKVKLIVPNSSSIYTATSTTKSAHSPQSAHSGAEGPRKPFFQRIFSIPKLTGPGSIGSGSSGGASKRLRRHTIGGPRLQGAPDVIQR